MHDLLDLDQIQKMQQMTPEQVAASCETAADLVEGHWIQGTWSSGSDDWWSYCIEGGLAAALGLEIDDAESFDRELLMQCPVYDAVLATVNEREGDRYGKGDLPNWNDYDERTEEEVVDVLRTTAKRVRGVPPDAYTSTP